MSDYKYYCKKCKYKTNYATQWNVHINTTLHKTGKRKVRSDRKCPTKCPQCDYTGPNNTNITTHILNNHSTTEEREKGFKYYCEHCDIGTFAKSIYNKHIKTKRHINKEKMFNKLD